MADEKVVKEGSKVQLRYVGRLESGELFDTNVKEEAEKEGLPLDGRTWDALPVEVGAQQVIPGFEKALDGMKEGETKEVTIAPEDAYGQPNDQAVQKVPAEAFKSLDAELKAGLQLLMQTPQGPLPITILEVSDTEVTIDANHPLAGKTLKFKITVEKIE